MDRGFDMQLLGAEGAITRVMSPNASEGFLLGIQGHCHRCQAGVYEPVVCTQCGTFGHPQCLGMERFQGYPFCDRCMPYVVQQYATFQTGQRRQEWTRSLGDQITGWRERAVEALGMSASMGWQ